MKIHRVNLAVLLLCPALCAAAVTFDGAVTYQIIEGFGVNANHRSWNNDELKPVLDALIDQAGMTLFRVVYDEANWETNNDNTDPNLFNWAYYTPVYTSAEFTKLWNLVAYLNSKGITTNGIMFNFMGPGPTWLGGSTLTSGKEDEWVEMITSLLVWARYTNGLQFKLVGPDNEPDILNEGIKMPVSQYTNCLHRLAVKLAANGLDDVRLVGPDLSVSGAWSGYMPQMLVDATLMAKLGHFGVHGYTANGADSAGVYDYIRSSAYPDRTFWMTEFNVWCSTCDSGTRGTYDWAYCKGTATYLLNHLANHASGGIVWEGYDSFYAHPPSTWSYWGLFSVDNTNAVVKTYTPRKHFYTLSQISKWVRPGAQQIGVSGSTGSFSPLLAYKHSGLGQVTIVGINTSSSAATLSGTLASLPTVPYLDLYYTSASTNLAFRGSVTVTNAAFSASVPADCVFTLVYGAAKINVTPTNALVVPGSTQQFAATASDSQGNAMNPQPVLSWSATGGGSISSNGLFTASALGGGTFNVIATSGNVSGMASVGVPGWGTVGNTNAGGFAHPIWNGGSWIDASRFQAASNVAVSTIHAKVVAIPGRYKCAIYSDSGGSPSSVVCGTLEVTNPVAGWHTFPLASAQALANGQYYWLAIWSDHTNAQVYYSTNQGSFRCGLYSYGAWPDPITLQTVGGLNYCIFSTGLPGQPGRTPPLVSIRLLGNGFCRVRSEGVPSQAYRVDYSGNLTNQGWLPLGSGTADDSGVVEYVDSLLNGLRVRFYRSAGL